MKCTWTEYKRYVEGELCVLNHDQLTSDLIETFKLQEDLEIRSKILHPKELGIPKQMFHWALMKCIKPKIHSQTRSTHQETEVL